MGVYSSTNLTLLVPPDFRRGKLRPRHTQGEGLSGAWILSTADFTRSGFELLCLAWDSYKRPRRSSLLILYMENSRSVLPRSHHFAVRSDLARPENDTLLSRTLHHNHSLHIIKTPSTLHPQSLPPTYKQNLCAGSLLTRFATPLSPPKCPGQKQHQVATSDPSTPRSKCIDPSAQLSPL